MKLQYFDIAQRIFELVEQLDLRPGKENDDKEMSFSKELEFPNEDIKIYIDLTLVDNYFEVSTSAEGHTGFVQYVYKQSHFALKLDAHYDIGSSRLKYTNEINSDYTKYIKEYLSYVGLHSAVGYIDELYLKGQDENTTL